MLVRVNLKRGYSVAVRVTAAIAWDVAMLVRVSEDQGVGMRVRVPGA